MSQELPYFKFFCDQWLSKKITLQSLELQGAFINVCAIYWANDCDIEIATLSNRYGEAINILVEKGFIKDKNGIAKISFLDSQWHDRYKNHKDNVKNGKAGALKRWDKHRQANSHPNSHPNSESIALREDKKRKEKIGVFFDEHFKLEYTEVNGEKIYGNLHQRGQGGLSEKAIKEHCINNGIDYEK